MRLLLDTQVVLWSDLLPARVHAIESLLLDEANDLFVSAVVPWEIVIKHGLGKLDLPGTPAAWFPAAMRALGATLLPVDHRHALAVADLPPRHRDPFDRLLVAQAKVEGLHLVSADPVFADYPVDFVAVPGG